MNADALAARVAKLLALALDQQGTPEGERAREAADRIIARHGLTEEDLAAPPSPEEIGVHVVPLGGRNMWRQMLMQAAGELAGLSVAFSLDGGTAILCGRRCDRRVAEYLLAAVHRQQDRAEVGMRASLLARVREGIVEQLGEAVLVAGWEKRVLRRPAARDYVAQWRLDFAHGVVSAARAVLKERQRAAEAAEGNRGAMVIRDRRAAAEQEMARRFDMQEAKKPPPPARSGGYHEGRRVQFGAALESSAGVRAAIAEGVRGE